MNVRTILPFLLVTCLISLSAAAETTVTLSDVHMCCGNCVARVETALKPVTGVTGVASQEKQTIVVTAPDKEAAQKGVNALLAAGYFGKSSDPTIKVEAPSGAPDGKVQTLTVSGVHLCCSKCVTVVEDVLAKVEGVTANTVAANTPSFTITGDFNAKIVFERLNAAGLAGKVSATPPATAPAR